MKDLSHLPTGDTGGGISPDPSPFYAPKLAEHWQGLLDDGSKAMAFPKARLRHSQAAQCARKIGFDAAGAEKTEPPDLASRWVMELGTLVHEQWQEAFQVLFPDAEVEKKVWIEESQSAGHIDLLDRGTAVELKTINGFGFKTAVGARGTAEGPRKSAITQGALNGLGSDADRVVIVNLAMENISPREAAKLGPEPWRRFCAEWTMEREFFEPIAKAEVARFVKILQFVDEGRTLPRAPTSIPVGARVVDVDKGTWQLLDETGQMIVGAGSTWECSYCDYRSLCKEVGL